MLNTVLYDQYKYSYKENIFLYYKRAEPWIINKNIHKKLLVREMDF